MARTKRNAMNIEEARTKIQTTQLVNRLTKHALGQKIGTVKVEMTPTQVTAALGLLKKAIPDLQSTQISGEVTTNYVARMPDMPQTADEWQQQQTKH